MLDGYLLAIDPGFHASGMSLFRFTDPRQDRQFLRAHHVTIKNDADALAALRDFLGDITPTFVLIERDTNPNNRSAIEGLAACRRIWRDALETHGVKPRQIFAAAPQSWQGPCGLLSRSARAAGDTKEASMLIACQRFAAKFKTDDESDATLMGDWWLAAGGPEYDAEFRARKKARAASKKSRGGWDIEDLKARGLI